MWQVNCARLVTIIDIVCVQRPNSISYLSLNAITIFRAQHELLHFLLLFSSLILVSGVICQITIRTADEEVLPATSLLPQARITKH